MTSNADVEIGDDIWITDHQHPYYGKAGKVITVGKELIGVRPNGSTSAVGIHLKVGQFVKVTFHKDWHKNEPAVPFQLSDSAIEWADGQRAARIDNLKKTVAFLQQEIERLETNAVTFEVKHNAPERTYNFAKDTVDEFSDTFEKARLAETDEIWTTTDQAVVVRAIWKWLKGKEMIDDSTREISIRVALPWEVLIKHRSGKKETVVFPLLEEREEVIDMIQGDSK